MDTQSTGVRGGYCQLDLGRPLANKIGDSHQQETRSKTTEEVGKNSWTLRRAQPTSGRVFPCALSSSGQKHDRSQAQGSERATTAMDSASGDQEPADTVAITTVQKMLSATSGSLLTGLLVTPLDVVRVRWQAQPSPQPPTDFSKLAVSMPNRLPPSTLGVTACCREVFFANNVAEVCVAEGPLTGSAAAECAVEQTRQRTFTSTLDGLRKIARHEGLAALWRGLSPTLVMAVPGNIIYFTGYEWLRFNANSPIPRVLNDQWAPLAAGAAARILAATAISPVEMFRTRLQASLGATARGHVADTFQGLRELVSTHGYRALWRGLTLTLWRDVPFSGMYWWGYEAMRGALTDWRESQSGVGSMDDSRYAGRGREELSSTSSSSSADARGRERRRSQSRGNHADTFTDSFVAGATSGALASVVTTPFDVGKTRTQVYRDALVTGTSLPEEQSMARLLWHIFKTEGMPGLFKGWIPRVLKVAPACAIMISSYEVGKRSFRGMNEQALRQDMDRRKEGR